MFFMLLLIAIFWPEDRNLEGSGLHIYDPAVHDPDYDPLDTNY